MSRSNTGSGRTIGSMNQKLPERGEAARGHVGTVTRGHGSVTQGGGHEGMVRFKKGQATSE